MKKHAQKKQQNIRAILLCIITLFFIFSTYSQQRLISGKLTDDDGAEIPGVNVYIKGTTYGTITDLDGNYSLEAPLGSTLVFAFVGYTSREMVVTKENSLPVGYEDTDEEDEESKSPATSNATKQTTGQASTKIHSLFSKKTQASEKKKIFKHKIPGNGSKTLSPYFFIKSEDPKVDNLPLESTDIDVNIAGVIADVKVMQRYTNAGAKPIEAIYIFPGSTQSAVYAMTMRIGERVLKAKIQEKQEARQNYEKAKNEGKTATLLEQQRPNVFQMNVANIMPGDTIDIELRYTELLIPVDGVYEFVSPGVVGPRYSNDSPDENPENAWVQNPFLSEGDKTPSAYYISCTINGGTPLNKLICNSHKIKVHFPKKTICEIELDEKMETNPGNRDFILRYKLMGNEIESGLLLHEHDDENFFLLMMQPPDSVRQDQIPPREYIFIVDVSGSMSGYPLDLSKKLMKNLLSGLNEETDLFNVMFFSGGNSVLFHKSEAASKKNIANAIQMIDSQGGGGGTELLPALKKALGMNSSEQYSRTFIVITDGYVNCEKEAFQLIRSNRNNANVFSFGIGSSINRYIIEGMAHAGMGEPFVVTLESEAEEKAEHFANYIKHPVMTNIKMNCKNVELYDIEPTSIPDVFANRPIIVYGKYKGKENANISISGFSGDTLIERTFAFSDVEQSNNQALRYLWARNKIKYLDDYAALYESAIINPWHTTDMPVSEDNKKEIIQLGLKYNLLSAYTSFIAIDNEVRNKTKSIEMVKQPLPLPKGVSNSAAGTKISSSSVYGASHTSVPATTSSLSLSTESIGIEDVVVVGYGTQKKSDVTGAIVSVNSEYIVKEKTQDIGRLVQSKAAGVVVKKSNGATGSSSTMHIRGSSSIYGINSPLFCIDGVAVNSHTQGLAHLQTGSLLDGSPYVYPDDIESVEILKDVSSSAVYGDQGANGVVLITTKSGRHNQSDIRLKSSYSFDMVNKLPELQKLYDTYNIFQTGHTFSNFASLSTGDSKLFNYISLGSIHSKGFFPNSEQKLYSARYNAKKQYKKFSIMFGSSFIKANGKNNYADISGMYLMKSILLTPPLYDNEMDIQTKIFDNPYRILNEDLRTNKSIQSLSYGRLNYNILHDLCLSSRVNFAYQKDEVDWNIAQNSIYKPKGWEKNAQNEFIEVTSSNTLSYDKTFVDVFRTKLLTGFDYSKSTMKYEDFVYETLSTGLDIPLNSSGATLHDLNKYNRSFFSRFDITLFDYLLFAVNASNTKKTKNDNVYIFKNASASSAFRFTDVINNGFDWLSTGKLRMTLGKVQKDFPDYLNSAYYSATNLELDNPDFIFRNSLYATILPEKPEDVFETAVGLDLGIFRDRFIFAFDVFRKKTHNGLLPESITENTIHLINGATLLNSGLEISISHCWGLGDFTWNGSIEFTKTKTIVKDLYNDTYRVPLAGAKSISTNAIEGQPLGVLYGTQYKRNDNGSLVIGDYGYPLVSEQMGVIGDPNPDWTMGILNTFYLKGFELSVLIDVKKGGDIWNGTKNTLNYYGISQETADLLNTAYYIYDGVTMDGAKNTVPVNFSGDGYDVNTNRWVHYGKTGVAEDAIEDASWVRFKEIKLGYSLPQFVCQKLKINHLGISLWAKNALLFTRYSGIDPESSFYGGANSTGVDYFNMPSMKSYGATLEIGF